MILILEKSSEICLKLALVDWSMTADKLHGVIDVNMFRSRSCINCFSVLQQYMHLLPSCLRVIDFIFLKCAAPIAQFRHPVILDT